MRYAMTILYVADQQLSRDFYRAVLGLEPSLDVPGMTEFRLNEGALLGLMPEEGIARLICAPPAGPVDAATALPHPATGRGIPRCELYLPADDPAAWLDRLIAAGGRAISPAELRNWGEVVAYGADPDGHLLAFAAET